MSRENSYRRLINSAVSKVRKMKCVFPPNVVTISVVNIYHIFIYKSISASNPNHLQTQTGKMICSHWTFVWWQHKGKRTLSHDYRIKRGHVDCVVACWGKDMMSDLSLVAIRKLYFTAIRVNHWLHLAQYCNISNIFTWLIKLHEHSMILEINTDKA